MWVAFALQKLLLFLQQKYQCTWNTFATTVNKFVINDLIKLMMLFFFFFVFGFYGPFKNVSYIKLMVHQRWGKTWEPGEKNHLTIRKQNLAFPHVTQARLEPQQQET